MSPPKTDQTLPPTCGRGARLVVPPQFVVPPLPAGDERRSTFLEPGNGGEPARLIYLSPWIQARRSVAHSGGSSPPGDRHACTVRDSLGIGIERLLGSVNALAQPYAVNA